MSDFETAKLAAERTPIYCCPNCSWQGSGDDAECDGNYDLRCPRCYEVLVAADHSRLRAMLRGGE